MVDRVEVAEVRIWNKLVGAIAWNEIQRVATFEFDPAFLETGLNLAPIMMPAEKARNQSTIFEFRTLPFETFHGLPGLLSDSLPDRFGNAIINQWLARKGRTPEEFSPVERLCYTGTRGMGALEFRPAIQPQLEKSVPVEISELMQLAQHVIEHRSLLKADLQKDPEDAVLNIIRVGTSAGGNRPKAVIALNEKTSDVRSGQVDAPEDYNYWILKFDGVQDTALGDPAGYGRIEYAYYLMAKAAGIDMMESRLIKESGRAHFMTRRFDRPGGKEKLHIQSLCGMAHYDFNATGAYSYEQAFQVMRELRLPYIDTTQQYRRMVFNVVARNQDDHTKNIAFIMNKEGLWRLAPAYDLTFAFNPGGLWTNRHQMSVNGKLDQFKIDDLKKVGQNMNIKSSAAILQEVIEVITQWPTYAEEAGVDEKQMNEIGRMHRTGI